MRCSCHERAVDEMSSQTRVSWVDGAGMWREMKDNVFDGLLDGWILMSRDKEGDRV